MQGGPPTDGRERPARLPGDSSLGSPSPRTVYQDAGKGWGNWSGLLLTPSFPPLPAFRYALTGAVGPAALGALDTAVTGEVAEKRLGPPSSERAGLRNSRSGTRAWPGVHGTPSARRGEGRMVAAAPEVCGRRGASTEACSTLPPSMSFSAQSPTRT